LDGGIVVPDAAPVPVEPAALGGALLGRRGRAVLEDGARGAGPRSPAEAREPGRRGARVEAEAAEAEVGGDGERGGGDEGGRRRGRDGHGAPGGG